MSTVQLLNCSSADVKIFFQWVKSLGIGLQKFWPKRILHMVVALLFQKLLPAQNKISVPLGGRPPCMSGMKRIILVLLSLGQVVRRDGIILVAILTVDIVELNGIKFILCPNCNVTQAAPIHILACISYYETQLLLSPATLFII
ncbi:hypothetical protein TNCV_912611 [Trichonephila clavipes]|nr:hypothetical protein TNCV_912611 [Trichonephila clavipes]